MAPNSEVERNEAIIKDDRRNNESCETDNLETSEVDAIERTTPAKTNIFAKFAYNSPSPSRRNTSYALGKRKHSNREAEDAVSDRNLVPITSPKTREPPDSSSGSKKFKVYAHLREIDDHLAAELDIIFCGINPGQKSAQIGHHYANPTNHFWSCLHESGLTSRKVDPREDWRLPSQFSIGLTNLVSRPTVQQSELSRQEQGDGVSRLIEKVARCRPRILCFVGVGIADVVKSRCIEQARMPKSKAAVGLQPYKMVYNSELTGVSVHETLFFAVSSTSGRVVHYQKTDKIQQFKDLRNLLETVKSQNLDTKDLIPILQPPSTAEDS